MKEVLKLAMISAGVLGCVVAAIGVFAYGLSVAVGVLLCISALTM